MVMLCSLISIATTANSAIVYSGRLDLDASNLGVDLNNDGSVDITSNWRFWGGGNGYSTSGFDVETNFDIRFLNTELGGIHAGKGYPGSKAPLEYGELIGSTAPQNLLWSYNSNDAMLWTEYNMWNNPTLTYSGEWHNLSNRYLGFELNIDSIQYYGWVQYNTSAENEVVLIDFAFENSPGIPITSGITYVPIPASIYFLLSGLLMLMLKKSNNTYV